MSIGQCGILLMIDTPFYPTQCTFYVISKETKINKYGFVSIYRASREHKWSIYHRWYSTLYDWLRTMSIGQCGIRSMIHTPIYPDQYT